MENSERRGLKRKVEMRTDGRKEGNQGRCQKEDIEKEEEVRKEGKSWIWGLGRNRVRKRESE